MGLIILKHARAYSPESPLTPTRPDRTRRGGHVHARLLSQVMCSGQERFLGACPPLVTPGQTDCSHRADAGVACSFAPFAGVGVSPTPVEHLCESLQPLVI